MGVATSISAGPPRKKRKPSKTGFSSQPNQLMAGLKVMALITKPLSSDC
jgi:hypothetical protein